MDNQDMYPRSPRELMEAIRKEYQASHGGITRKEAETRLSERLGWKPSRWGNVERGNPDFEISMMYEMVESGIIEDKGTYYYEFLDYQTALDIWTSKHGMEVFDALRKAASQRVIIDNNLKSSENTETTQEKLTEEIEEEDEVEKPEEQSTPRLILPDFPTHHNREEFLRATGAQVSAGWQPQREQGTRPATGRFFRVVSLLAVLGCAASIGLVIVLYLASKGTISLVPSSTPQVQVVEKEIAPEVTRTVREEVAVQPIPEARQTTQQTPHEEASPTAQLTASPRAAQPRVTVVEVVATPDIDVLPYIPSRVYMDTGVGTTKAWTIDLEDGLVLIVGGYKVNGEENGVYRAWRGPQQVAVEVTDGFATIVPSTSAELEWNFRLNQARAHGWPTEVVVPLSEWQ